MKIQLRKFVASVTAFAFLIVSAAAGAAAVYVQYDRSTVLTDPALVSASGSDFEVSANLQSGEFKGRAEGQGSSDQNTYSGSIASLIFTNNTGSPIVIGAGDFTARVQGDYSFGTGPNQVAQTNASLQVRIAGQLNYIASAGHTVAIGNLLSNPGSTFTPGFQQNGASVVLTTASTSQLIMDLLMPELTLAPGATMKVDWGSTPLVGTDATQGMPGNFAEADFFTGANGMTLALILPVGVTLDSDSTVPLDWVTNGPPPADLRGTIRTSAGTDVCAMVLASGQFMFSCNPVGVFSLAGLPREQDGTVKRQIYADGFFPKIDVLTGSTIEAVVMTRSGTCPRYNTPYSAAFVPGSAGQRIDITGKVLQQVNQIPVCAMVLANGQHMFSCDGSGSYALNIPLDDNGQFKLQVYADGFAPTIQTFDEHSTENDVRMARAAECQSP